MNKETHEALKNVVSNAREYAETIKDKRNKEKLYKKAVLYRDIVTIEDWIDEVAKEYTEPMQEKDIERDENGDEIEQ